MPDKKGHGPAALLRKTAHQELRETRTVENSQARAKEAGPANRGLRWLTPPPKGGKKRQPDQGREERMTMPASFTGPEKTLIGNFRQA